MNQETEMNQTTMNQTVKMKLDIQLIQNVLILDDTVYIDNDECSDSEYGVCSLLDDDKYSFLEFVLDDFDKFVRVNVSKMSDYKYKILWKEYLNEYITDYLENFVGELELFNTYYRDFEVEEEYVDELVNEALSMYESVVPSRSNGPTHILYPQTDEMKESITKRLNVVYEKDKLCAEQRTPLWYEQRYTKLSASSAWKALDTERMRNSIILQKCKPLDTTSKMGGSINTPFHWGHKFEPVSQAYYEFMYGVDVEEFGCIPHSEYDYLGASPDGIVTGPYDNERYGRMLEIKNIWNREINGIPKKEYWVQMQMQMECCNLDECDFLECRFKLYETEEDFNDDGTFQFTEDGCYKGVIIMFYKDETPFYEYAPFHCDRETFEVWEKEIMEKHKDVTWVRNEYWFLQEVSCVLVQRNRVWFNSVKDKFKKTWETILYEREHGYEHREPQKRQRKLSSVDENDKIKVVLTKLPEEKTCVDTLFNICNFDEENMKLDQNLQDNTERDNTESDLKTVKTTVKTTVKHVNTKRKRTKSKVNCISLDDL